MRSRAGVSVVVVAACLLWVGSAGAAGTYKVCAKGAGKPLVSPGPGGSCASGQKSVVLATGSALTSLQTQVANLKTKVASLSALLSGVSRSGHTLVFKGMNLQVESGSGSTAGTVNGLGNVIIGYNESPGKQTGSNNLVVGSGQSFTSYGGIVGGQDNSIAAPFASVTGGQFNLAGDSFSSIAGGCDNTTGTGSARTAACNGTGAEAILGGSTNTATGLQSTLLGGYLNKASGVVSSLSGGESNIAADELSSILGGCDNITGAAVLNGDGCSSLTDETIGGGFNNTATGPFAAVGGGTGNTSSGDASSVAGGDSNTASVPGSSVTGGYGNYATGNFSSVTGGEFNAATDRGSSILGGCLNVTGTHANPNALQPCDSNSPVLNTISGGESNTAKGLADSILGGLSVSLTGNETHSP